MATAIAVVKEMLADRGVGLGELATVGDKEIADLAAEHGFFHLAAEDRDVVVVTQKLKTQDLQKAAAVLDDSRRSKAIIIVQDKPLSFHRNCVAASYGNAEIFCLGELQYNVSRHELVPPHRKMTDAEVKDVLQTYMLNDRRGLPAIWSTDPMAKYLGLRPGDVVEITRASPAAGTSVYYRHCVGGKLAPHTPL